jgi:hypothetical protein
LADPASDPGPDDEPRPLHALQAELIATTGAILLLVSLLFFKWFGVGGPVGRFAPRAVATGSEGAWHTLTALRWLALLTIVVALVPLPARSARRWFDRPRGTNAAVAALGGVTALLLGYRVLVDLPDSHRVVDQKAGAIIGLLGALLIAVGGLESMRAHPTQVEGRGARTRSRGPSAPPGRIARVHA